MWLREQKLKAGIGFSTAVIQLLDYLKETLRRPRGERVGEPDELRQEIARSSFPSDG